MGSSGHVACMGGIRNIYRFYFTKQCVDEMIILKYMLEKLVVFSWLLIGSNVRQNGGEL